MDLVFFGGGGVEINVVDICTFKLRWCKSLTLPIVRSKLVLLWSFWSCCYIYPLN